MGRPTRVRGYLCAKGHWNADRTDSVLGAIGLHLSVARHMDVLQSWREREAGAPIGDHQERSSCRLDIRQFHAIVHARVPWPTGPDTRLSSAQSAWCGAGIT